MKLCLGFFAATAALFAQTPPAAPAAEPDPIKTVVSRLDLEKYKATIKGLTRFGDRRQGTERNRAAIDWIEALLKSYGCANIERIRYDYQPPAGRGPAPNADGGNPPASTPGAAPAGAGRGGRGGRQGGGTPRGIRAKTGVNNDPNLQPDEKLRALNTPPSVAGERQEVFCTKVGVTHPEEMYIVSAHMDGIGWGEAANDDGSGTAIVMEAARILSSPDVQTERSIRFVLWNNEESGTNGAQAYVTQRNELQGKESPAGSGKYPEPKWLGVIQHDMMLFDHGMPLKDGTMPKTQRPEADVNIEFQSASKMAKESAELAWKIQAANEKYATDYPATVGAHMTNTDSGRFQDLAPSVSLRENERGPQIGNGWDPHWHQPTDVYATFNDDDFRLGLNAAQTTLGAVSQLAGLKLKQ